MQHKIIIFFEQVLLKDFSVLSLISKAHDVYFDEEDGTLIFGLEGLYQLIGSHPGSSYAGFIREIYQGNINEVLKKSGAKIVLHKSSGKVKTSLYKLVSLKK